MIIVFGCSIPMSMIVKSGFTGFSVFESALSVITIHGGSPSPVYPSTAALLT